MANRKPSQPFGDTTNVRELPTYCGDDETITRDETFPTSTESVEAISYTLRRTWFAQAGSPTKYLMIRITFLDDFPAGEVERLREIFSKFLEIGKGYGNDRNLWGDTPYGFENVITDWIRPLDKSRPHLNDCTLAPNPGTTTWSDHLYLRVFFIGYLANYLDSENSAYCPAKPEYFPILLRRYEKPQQPDGFWEYASAPIYNHFINNHSWLINVNTTALNNAGGSNRRWAASMFHEILHNLGWEHPDGYDNRKQFILAAQDAFYACGTD